jgi:uncharacterized membrane protein YfcA
MSHLDIGELVLFSIALVAAAVNGAIGYGFSSLTVPVALLYFPNRLLAPALVMIELAINAGVVYLNRANFFAARRRAAPILLGLAPGVLIGSLMLSHVDSASLKVCTYAVLLPIVLLQAGGFRRPIRAEATAGFSLGAGVGALYATTTISGPPLAMMLNNQGLEKEHFRGTIGIVRVAETTLTAISYAWLGLYSAASFHLLLYIAPAVLIGLPLGAFVIRFMPVETFRRICMSFDAWVIGFGLARAIIRLDLLKPRNAYGLWLGVVLFDLCLLIRYFATRLAADSRADAATYRKIANA